MKRALLLLTRLLLPLVVGSCCVFRCSPRKLPTPIATGPDSGWVRAPVKFTARNLDGTLAGPSATYDWGDGASSIDKIHTYSVPGLYLVVCRACEFPSVGPIRYSEPSEPHPIRILEDVLVYPDTMVAAISLGPGYHVQACVLPNGSRLYLNRAEVDSVSVMETQTNTVVAVVPVQDSPVCCVASGSGEFVYVLNSRSGTVSVIRTSDNTVVDTIDAGYLPNSMELLPGDSLLYVGYAESSLVSVYRTDNASCVARIETQAIPSGMAARPGGGYVFIASESGDRVTVLRTSDNTIASTVTLSGGPADFLFSPGGETAYVTCPSGGYIALMRTTDLSVLAHVSYDSMGFGGVRHVAELPGGPCLYATAVSKNGNRVAVLRRSDNYLLRNYHFGGSGIAGPAVPLPDRSRVYVPTSVGVYVLGLRQSR